MSSQGGGGGVGSGNFPINITGNAAGLDAIIKSVAQYEAQLIRAALASTNFASSASRVGPALSGNAAGANQFSSSMKGANTTMDQFTGTSNQAAGAAGNFQRTTTALGTATGQFANTTNQANSSARGYQSTIISLGQGTGQFASQTSNANSSAKGFQSTIVGLGQGTGQFANSMGQANQQAGGFTKTTVGLGQATGTLKTNLNGTSTGFKDMGDQAETASNKTSNSINNVGGAVTSMVGKVSGLFIGFTGMTMAMQEAAGMSEMLKAAQEKVVKAQERVNQAIEQYGKGSHQHTQATQAMEKAQNGLAFAQRNANFAIGDTYYFMALMSTQILSSVVPALIKWKETKQSIISAIDFLKRSLTELPAKILAKSAATTADTAAETANAAATNASGLAKTRAIAAAIGLGIAHKFSALGAGIHSVAIGVLTGVLSRLGIAHTVSARAAAVHSTIMGVFTASVGLATRAMAGLQAALIRNMAVLGPIGAVLIAIGLAMAALSTDFMGSRTAVEGFGQSIGDTIPILKPFMDGIQGIGGVLGLTGETAEETQTHFDRMSLGFQNMGTLWHDTVALMQNSNIALVADIGFTVAGVSTALATMNTDFGNQVNASIDTWNKFVHALSQGDFSGAVDILSESLSAIPAILSRIGQRVGELVDEIWKGLKAIGTDLLKEFGKVGAALQGLFGEIGKRIVTWLGNIVTDVTNWVNENVVEPILGFLDSIGIPATEIWTAIVGAAGALASTVTAWVTENIVNPILAFIDSIQTDPAAIWNAISGGATSIASTVTAWVTENIVNPILEFITKITTDPQAIFTAILGTATSILSSVESWVKTNIVTPILDIPNQLKDIVIDVVKKLGLTGSASPGEVAAFVLKVAMDIMTLPGKIVSKAKDIVSKLLGSDWGETVKGWLQGIWDYMFGWAKGAQPPGGTGGVNTSEAANMGTDAEQATLMKNKMIETGVPPEQAESTARSQYNIPSNVPILYNQPPTGGVIFASGTGGGFSNVSSDMDKVNANRQELDMPVVGSHSDAGNANKQLQSSDLSGNINQMVEADQQAAKTAQSYEQAKAKLQEWTDVGNAKAGSTEKHLALGSQELLQNEELFKWYGANEAAVAELGSRLESKNNILDTAKENNKKLSNAVVGTTLAMADGSLQSELSKQGFLEQTHALQKMEMETIKNASALTTYAAQLGNGRIQQAAFTLGEQEQQKALYDKEVAISQNAGRLKEYGKQLQDGKILQLAFTEGEQGQEQALYDKGVALAENAGRLKEYGEQIQEGTILSLAYIEGQQAITEEYLAMQEETANLNGQFDELSAKLNDTNAQQIVFNKGMAEGRLEAARMVQGITDAIGNYTGYREVLMDTADALYMTADATKLTNEELENFVQVASGAPDAVYAFIDSLEAFGESVVADIAGAMKEGKKEVKDAFEEIEKTIGDTLTGKEREAIKIMADASNVIEEVNNSISLAFSMAKNQKLILSSGQMDASELTEAIVSRIDEAMERAEQRMNESTGAISTAWRNVYEELGKIKTDPLNTDRWIESANRIAASFATITGDGQVALQFMQSMGFDADTAASALNNAGFAMDGFTASIPKAATTLNSFTAGMSAAQKAATDAHPWVKTFADNANQAGTAATTAGGNMTGLTTGIQGTGTAATTATPEVQAFYNTIANFGTIEAVAITIFTQKLPEHAKTGAAAMATEFQGLSTQIAPTFGEIENLAIVIFATNIPAHAAAGIPFVVAAFSLLPANIAPIFGELEALTLIIFANNIPMHAATGIPFIVAAFSLLPSNIAPIFGTLESFVMTILVTNIPAHAAAMNPLVTNQFGTMVNLATTQLLVLSQNADKSFKAIGGFAVVVPTAVAEHFGKAAQDGINLIKAMESGTRTAFSQMAANALRTANHVGYIGNAANWAEIQVNALKSAIDSLQDKTVTITIVTRYRTIGSPAGGGRRTAQFGMNEVVDKPTLILAGEGSGPETVRITPGTMGANSMIGQNNNVNVDSQVNNQSNVGGSGSGSIVQTSTNNQVNGGNNGAMVIQNGNIRIMIGSDGSVSIVSGNQTITTGPNGTSIIMNGNNQAAGGGIRNTNPNPADSVQNGNQAVSGGSVVGQNNNVNVQSDTNTQNNTSPNGTINTQSGPGYSQSATVVSGSGQSTGSGRNIAYQRNNSGETLVIDGQTYQAMNMNNSTSPSSTEFRRRRQTGSNAGPSVRTVVEQALEINVTVDKYKLGRAVRKLMYDMEEGLYR